MRLNRVHYAVIRGFFDYPICEVGTRWMVKNTAREMANKWGHVTCKRCLKLKRRNK